MEFRSGDDRTALQRCGAGEGFFAGEVAGEAFERKVLFEGVVGITIPHEDAAEVGVAVEAKAHHVEDFALVPIGTLVDGDDGIDGGVILADLDFEAEVILIMRATEDAEFVDDLVAGFVAEVSCSRGRISDGRRRGG